MTLWFPEELDLAVAQWDPALPPPSRLGGMRRGYLHLHLARAQRSAGTTAAVVPAWCCLPCLLLGFWIILGQPGKTGKYRIPARRIQSPLSSHATYVRTYVRCRQRVWTHARAFEYRILDSVTSDTDMGYSSPGLPIKTTAPTLFLCACRARRPASGPLRSTAAGPAQGRSSAPQGSALYASLRPC